MYHKTVPRRVDHALRRRQITDAVCRITIKGGLAAATFREVAAEAGVSVRLVQYYFGTKDQLLLSTQQHVADRATRRVVERVAAAGDTPRDALRALLGAFIPTDDDSRENMLMFVALHTASLVDPTLARAEALAVPRGLHAAIAGHLRRGPVPPGADPDLEAAILAGLVPSLAQAVLAGLQTAEGAMAILEYAIDRAVAQATSRKPASEFRGGALRREPGGDVRGTTSEPIPPTDRSAP
jgi:TetR/AcrR family transcriptional repressor of bet genes